MANELFQAILNKEFYLANKDILTKDLFEGSEIRDLFETVKWAYEDRTDIENLSIAELKALHEQRFPNEPTARRMLISKLLSDIAESAELTIKTANLVLKQAVINLKQNEAASILCQMHKADIERVKEIVNDIEKLKNNEKESDIVNLDIASLLERTSKNCQWKFNIPALAEMVTGIGDSTFTLIAGRVNSGKSLAALSFCFSPGGFADQGAKILYLCNEEDGAFPGLRAVSSYTGMTFAEIANNKEEAAREFAKIRNNSIILDNAKMSMHGLVKMVEKYKPNVIVADMLDHIQINGDYARDDQRLGQVYRQAREISKTYRCAFVGVSQTSAESDGKLHYGFDALANSKTEKPAACDLILLLGAEAPDDLGNYKDTRAINIAKNKITGRHGAVGAVIKPFISRLVP